VDYEGMIGKWRKLETIKHGEVKDVEIDKPLIKRISCESPLE
jgi:hypothetical protein